MRVLTLQGRISQVQHATETSGAIVRGSGQIQSSNAWSFRVDKRAVVFKSKGGASLSDGDLVTVAGKDAKGTFNAMALRNDTTGAAHNAPAMLLMVLGGLLTLLGLPLLVFFVGLLIVPFGLWLARWGMTMREANRLLEVTPPASAV